MKINKSIILILSLITGLSFANNIDIQNDKIYKDINGYINYSFNVCKNFKKHHQNVEFKIDEENYKINDYEATNAYWDNNKLQCEFTKERLFISDIVFSLSPEETLQTSNLSTISPFAQLNDPLLNNIDNNLNILFMYDKKSQYFKNRNIVDSKIMDYIERFDESMENSNLNLSLENVGVVKVDSNILDLSYHEINTEIVNGNAGFEEINDLMNKSKADFYVFINNERLEEVSSDGTTVYVAGAVEHITGNVYPNGTSGYGNLKDFKYKKNGMTIYSDNDESTFTLSHEFGHLLGLWHDDKTHPISISNSRSTLPYGRGFVDSNDTFGTIMSYEQSGTIKQYFSNPYYTNCNNNNIPCGKNKYSINNNNEYDGADSVAALNVTVPQILNFKNRTDNTPTINVATDDDDIIAGTKKRDVIFPKKGDDIIIGSKTHDNNNQFLRDSETNDLLYDVIGLGDGHNQFHIMNPFEMGNTKIAGFTKKDKLVFKESFPLDFMINQVGNDLILENMMTNYKIKITDFYPNNKYIIEFDYEIGHEILKANNRLIIGENYSDILGNSDQNSMHYKINEGPLDSSIQEGYTFVPNEGNDIIYGSRYGDTYIYEHGGGHDFIYDYSCEPIQSNTKDTIKLVNYNQGDITFKQSNDSLDLVIEHNNSPIISVKNYFDGIGCYEVEEIEFSDESILDLSTISFVIENPEYCNIENFITDYNYVCGTSSDDAWGNKLTGAYNLKNIMYGFEGLDMLYGGAMDDILYGGPGNDYLYSNHGNNQLYGGPGNDTMSDGLAMESNLPNEYHSGPGDNKIYGTEHKDTIYITGNGENILVDWSCVVDEVIFDDSILPQNVTVYPDLDTLYGNNYVAIYIDYVTGRLRISNLHSVDLSVGNCTGFVNLNFDNGEKWTWNELLINAGVTSNSNGSLLLD